MNNSRFSKTLIELHEFTKYRFRISFSSCYSVYHMNFRTLALYFFILWSVTSGQFPVASAFSQCVEPKWWGKALARSFPWDWFPKLFSLFALIRFSLSLMSSLVFEGVVGTEKRPGSTYMRQGEGMNQFMLSNGNKNLNFLKLEPAHEHHGIGKRELI